MKAHGHGVWAMSLSPAQRTTVKRIRASLNPGRITSASDGWTVYMMPTTQPARYLELRHYMTGGGLARWVIERDGTVSADNDEGQLPGLRSLV